jgi:hypothetical protein
MSFTILTVDVLILIFKILTKLTDINLQLLGYLEILLYFTLKRCSRFQLPLIYLSYVKI